MHYLLVYLLIGMAFSSGAIWWIMSANIEDKISPKHRIKLDSVRIALKTDAALRARLIALFAIGWPVCVAYILFD